MLAPPEIIELKSANGQGPALVTLGHRNNNVLSQHPENFDVLGNVDDSPYSLYNSQSKRPILVDRQRSTDWDVIRIYDVPDNFSEDQPNIGVVKYYIDRHDPQNNPCYRVDLGPTDIQDPEIRSQLQTWLKHAKHQAKQPRLRATQPAPEIPNPEALQQAVASLRPTQTLWCRSPDDPFRDAKLYLWHDEAGIPKIQIFDGDGNNVTQTWMNGGMPINDIVFQDSRHHYTLTRDALTNEYKFTEYLKDDPHTPFMKVTTAFNADGTRAATAPVVSPLSALERAALGTALPQNRWVTNPVHPDRGMILTQKPNGSFVLELAGGTVINNPTRFMSTPIFRNTAFFKQMTGQWGLGRTPNNHQPIAQADMLFTRTPSSNFTVAADGTLTFNTIANLQALEGPPQFFFLQGEPVQIHYESGSNQLVLARLRTSVDASGEVSYQKEEQRYTVQSAGDVHRIDWSSPTIKRTAINQTQARPFLQHQGGNYPLSLQHAGGDPRLTFNMTGATPQNLQAGALTSLRDACGGSDAHPFFTCYDHQGRPVIARVQGAAPPQSLEVYRVKKQEDGSMGLTREIFSYRAPNNPNTHTAPVIVKIGQAKQALLTAWHRTYVTRMEGTQPLQSQVLDLLSQTDVVSEVKVAEQACRAAPDALRPS